MAVADKMIRAVNDKKATEAYENRDMAEARLAALLHDCGHGPFSHASEFVYDKMSTELEDVRSEDRETFGGASGHEILSYLIVTSQRFKRLWEDICARYDTARENLLCDLAKIDLQRIAHMIVGVPTAGCPKYLCQIVNGPFDADKFDYILRDGYFSGLVTSVDIARLAVSLDLHREPGHEPELCMDIAGATILEQLLFSKMLLFSSMYHHHKVRSAFRKLVFLFTEARRLRLRLGGANLSSAAGFLKLDDYNVISFAPQYARLNGIALSVRDRRLPQRILVIDRETLSDTFSKVAWVDLGANPTTISNLESEIASAAKLNKGDVFVDFPPEPGVYKTANYSMIKRSPNGPLVPLDRLYPVGGWLAGYEHFRFRSYVLGPAGSEDAVADSTKQTLQRRGISVDWETASRLAKRETR
ncbi:MAG: HD domain-containing protein [Chloroflexi bacterium]|nr:HD domain-containing protein [Chloroflexota bacterium]